MRATIRKLLLPVAFLAVALPAGVGVVMAMGDHKSTTDESAFTAISQGAQPHFARRAEPRWERVMTLGGRESAKRSFAIADHAIQWKAVWSCRTGAFAMTVPATANNDTVADAGTCPDVGDQTSSGDGPRTLQVSATGPWQVIVSQQVDTALREPPLAGMTDAAMLARGRFHSIQKHGEGTVSLYRLSSGRLALRFEHFYTSASPGLRLWLSRVGNVNSTLQARQAHHIDAGVVRSTLGAYNQMLPASVSTDDFHTIVIWCPTVLIAFSAAPLSSAASR